MDVFAKALNGNFPVIIKYLSKDSRMSIKEVFVEDGIIVGQSLGQPRQPVN